MSELRLGCTFDPNYGYDLDGLQAVELPPEPPGFAELRRKRYDRALSIDPRPALSPSAFTRRGLEVLDLEYRSSDDFPIRGWLFSPAHGRPTRGCIVGHGYRGIECPDFEFRFADAVYLVPCFRGLCQSRRPPVSDSAVWHVLHNIRLHDRFILGGGVEDLWTGVTAAGVTGPIDSVVSSV